MLDEELDAELDKELGEVLDKALEATLLATGAVGSMSLEPKDALPLVEAEV